MSTPGPDDPTAPSQPSAELGGLDPKDLLNAGLETVPPVTLPPRLVDSDATIAVSRPQPTQPRNDAPELPLPEELTNLLPHGNYSVESFLGQGGMGAVYKGMQVRLKRPVAIKIMRRDLGKDHDFEARFEREAQAMAKLNHPNIVSVIDFGEAGPDYLYIVMELIDGADLMDVIRGGQMTQEMALSLLPQICDALQFAHDHGIVHRDIKPSNIMLTRDGRIKMADFGLAKRFDVESSFRTQTGTGMGTPDYAAPEQFSPDTPIDHRADIYALGVMIYQMITGHLPRGVWKPPSQRAKVSSQWDAVVSRAMQSDPCDRYQQASEVKTDVERVSKLVPPDAPSAPSSTNSLKAGVGGANQEIRSTSRSRAPLLVGLVVGVIVIAVGAFFALKGPDESGRGHQTATEASPVRALASTPTSTVSIPGLPDLPPLTVPPGAPRLVKEFPLSGGTVRGLHLLPDSRRLLIMQDATIKLQDLETGGTAWLIKAGMGAVASAINEDGTRVVVAYPFDAAGKALVGPGPDGGYFEVNLHEMSTGKALQSWKVPYKSTSSAYDQIALSPSGKMIIVRTGGKGDGPTTFVALEVGKSEPVAQWTAAGHKGDTTHALSETAFISTGSGAPFQMNTAAPAAKVNQPTWLAEVKYSSVFSPDRRWVVASNGSSCSVWDMTTGKSHLLENSEITFTFGGFAGNDLALRFQSKAEFSQRNIQVWDRATGRALAEYPPSKPGFYWGIYSAGAPNGQFFVNVVAPLPTAANKSDRILQVWSLPKPGQVHGLVKPPSASPAIAAPALPESGWKPLVSKEEWETNWEGSPVNYGGKLVLPNRRFNKEGLLHMQSTSLYKPSPSADGAIRVESVIRQLPHVINLGVRRRSGDQGRYAFGMGKDGNSLLMRFITTDAAMWGTLQSCPLPTPLKIGDRLKLELRIQGSQITGLCNGVAVLQAQDQRLTAAGEWGLDVVDASIKSVEVQSLPTATTPAPIAAPPLPESGWKPLYTEAEWRSSEGSKREFKDGLVHLRTGWRKPQPSADGAIRAKIRYQDGTQAAAIVMRQGHATRRYSVGIGSNASSIFLVRTEGAEIVNLARLELPKPLKPGDSITLELRVQGGRISASADGMLFGPVTDNQLILPGEWGLHAINAWFESVEVQPLPAAAVSPSPSLPISARNASRSDAGGAKSPDPKFPPGQWVKLFTKPEDLPANMRKPDSGVTWDNGWIRFDVGKAQRLHVLDSLTNYGIRAKILREGESIKTNTCSCGPMPLGGLLVIRYCSMPTDWRH